MAFLDKNGLQTLTNKLVQGDAIKVASHRGHTVANVIDNITRECENVATPNTMTLENRVSEFKVGKGRDVDVSGDVEEGKIEVELQGKTWQNVVPKMENGYMLSGSQSKVEDGIVYIKANGKDHMQKYWTGSSIQLIKPNTTYTVVSYIYENYLDRSFNIINNYAGKNGDLALTSAVVSRGYTGIYIGTFRTKESFEDAKRLGFLVYNNTNGTVVFSVPYILEGDYTQTPTEELPRYFENIKSSFEDGVVDLEVVGKNLIEKNSFETSNGLLDITNVIKTGETYSLSYKIDSMSSDTPYIRLRFQGRNKDGSTDYFGEVFAHEYIGKRVFPKPLKFNKQYEKIELLLQVFSHGATCSVSDVQLEMSTVATSYEPYYKKKISFNIGEPLRSLPNGICDEIRNNNGQWELIRRTGCTQVDGINTHFASCYNNDSKTNVYEVTLRLTNIKESSIAICNKYSNIVNYTLDSEHFYTYASGDMVFFINKNKIDNQTGVNLTEKVNNLVKIEPIEIIYELAEPIITPIDSIKFETQPLGTITVNSDIAPVSYHTVQLNRAGQIEQGIVQIAELKKRVDTLETVYDSYLLETQHKLSLLGFEYELESEEI